MKTYMPEELNEILELHEKWLNEKENGVRADLSFVDLHSANLHYVNLSYADLSYTDLSFADLSYANLHSANLSYANLHSADLHSANLSSANLSYANLHSADLRYVTGEMRYIKSIQCEKYCISYTYKKLNIGCQSYLIEDWKNFTDEQISKMDRGALDWWKVWKPILMNIIEVSPCEAHKDEE